MQNGPCQHQTHPEPITHEPQQVSQNNIFVFVALETWEHETWTGHIDSSPC